MSKKTQQKKVLANKSQDDIMKERMKLWTTFYRANIHRFIEHYLGVELFLFQKILMYFMNINTYFMLVASRG